jgi:hypothetical protein
MCLVVVESSEGMEVIVTIKKKGMLEDIQWHICTSMGREEANASGGFILHQNHLAERDR